jgi:hypothetical protein
MIIWRWLAGRLVPVERAPNQDRARIAQLDRETTVLLLIAAVLLIDVVLRSMTNRPDMKQLRLGSATEDAASP